LPWLTPLFTAPPRIEEGRLVPPPSPGLGLEVDPDAIAKYHMTF
jgi:L-alanine-DL-glutamate epimerase-like enolase superfamily enzyme